MRFTRILSIGITSVRFKEFRIKPKNKGARRKSPCEFALEHFDFFYGPIFQNRWSSIRLGLLCDAKISALMNNFTDHQDQLKELIDLGAIDLLEDVQSGETYKTKKKSHTDEENSVKNVNFDEKNAEMSSTNNFDRKIDNHDDCESSFEHVNESIDLSESRGTDALSEFVQPSVTLEKSNEGTGLFKKKDMKPAQKPYMGPVDIDIVADEIIDFPKDLKLMAFPRGCLDKFTIPTRTSEDVYGFYLLDASTIFAVLALNLKSGDHVLDMCCAPGGTSLAMLQTLLPENLMCNDVSKSRTNKARNILNQFIPNSSAVRQIITMKAIDPTKSESEWKNLNLFDKVMCNVPCTHDRHSLMVEKDQDDNMFRPQFNAERLVLPDRQTKLLKAGLKSLRKNGTLVYTTATLSPIQNDAVVENALREIVEENEMHIQIRDTIELAEKFRRAGTFQLFTDCRYGLLIVPFLPSNFGPMYISKMVRVA